MFTTPQVALGVTLCIIPVSVLIGYFVGKVRERVVARTDARVKLITEVITGIKAIKLYAWEQAYVDKIRELRGSEMLLVMMQLTLSMLNYLTFSVGPILIAISAFGTYVLQGKTLTAEMAFPSLVLLNNLQFPIIMLPFQVRYIVPVPWE